MRVLLEFVAKAQSEYSVPVHGKALIISVRGKKLVNDSTAHLAERPE